MWLPVDNSQPATKLLLQGWQELFSLDTPESFRVRYSTPVSLVREVGEVARLAVENQRWEKHLRWAQEELSEEFPTAAQALGLRDQLSLEVQLLAKEQNASRCAQQAENFLGHGLDIGEQVIAALRNLDVSKEKHTALRLLAMAGAAFCERGIPASRLTAFDHHAALPRPPDEVLDAIQSRGSLAPGRFTCVLFATGDSGDIRAVLQEADGAFARRHLRPSAALSACGPSPEDVEDSNPLALTLDANSPFHAAVEASGRMRQVFDLFEFYRMGRAVDLSQHVLVWRGSNPEWIDVSGPRPEALRQRRNARALTQRFIREVGMERVDGRLANALDQFAVAQQTPDLRVRLVGVWSAFESLTGGDPSVSVLDRVQRAVVPAVVWRRTERIARYLAISFHQAGAFEKLTARDRDAYFPSSTKRSFRCEEMLWALCRPKNHPAILALLSAAANQPLLVQRLYRTWEEVHDPKKLCKRLELSERRLKWHLARIYRARNLIVHHGDGYAGSATLVRHLEYYFSTTVSKILHDLVQRPCATLDMAITALAPEHSLLKMALQRAPHTVTTSHLVRPAKTRKDDCLYGP